MPEAKQFGNVLTELAARSVTAADDLIERPLFDTRHYLLFPIGFFLAFLIGGPLPTGYGIAPPPEMISAFAHP